MGIWELGWVRKSAMSPKKSVLSTPNELLVFVLPYQLYTPYSFNLLVNFTVHPISVGLSVSLKNNIWTEAEPSITRSIETSNRFQRSTDQFPATATHQIARSSYPLRWGSTKGRLNGVPVIVDLWIVVLLIGRSLERGTRAYKGDYLLKSYVKLEFRRTL